MFRMALTEAESAASELEVAQNHFNMVEPEQTDEAIYRMIAAENRLIAAEIKVNRIIGELKQKGAEGWF
jgi:hypothetical protein